LSPLQDVALWIVPTVPIAAAAWLRRPKAWFFLGSTAIGLGAELVNSLVGLMTFYVLLAWQDRTASPDELRAQTYGGGWMALVLIVASPFTLGVVVGAIRIVRQDLADYLALRWPSAGELGRGVAMMVVLLLVWYLVAYLTGQKPSGFVIDGYRTAKQSGWLPVYLIALCIVAPVTEEFLVRGFLFRGWSQSFLGPVGAIALTSAAWAAVHTQYNLFTRRKCSRQVCCLAISATAAGRPG
jgi:membrane protease YdiL (CAAX protease family)